VREWKKELSDDELPKASGKVRRLYGWRGGRTEGEEEVSPFLTVNSNGVCRMGNDGGPATT